MRRRYSIARYFEDHALRVDTFGRVAELQSSGPNVDLMLLHYDPGDIAELFDAMSDRGTWIPVIVYACDPRSEQIVDAVLMGVMDFLAWPFTAAQLEARLKVLLGRRERFAELRRKATKAQQLVGTLSQREREVLFALASGASNKTIAQQLEISPRTVEIHRANMMGKLGAAHQSEAISIALYAALSGPHQGGRVDPAALV